MFSTRKSHPMLVMVNNSLVDLPSPTNISYLWNFGSILGLIFLVQMLSGIFLALHFCANSEISFSIVSHIVRDVNMGSMIRIIHTNTASFFFLFLYFHIGRGMYYNSFYFVKTWFVGVMILLMLMATAFLGYVLPWGQMSFWGATVITNLLSAVPYVGEILVTWLWGGFSVNNATLTRFFTFHFLLPFILIFLVMVHLTNLHLTGSNNPLGMNSSFKVSFYPYFSSKDFFGFIILLFILIMISTLSPFLFGDPENFIPSNPMLTPIHIQPEWYFLFAYAILRSIPNKLGGVMALLLSIMVLFIMPLMKYFTPNSFLPTKKLPFWMFINMFIFLTWIGAHPVEDPYVLIGQILTGFYFLYFLYPLFYK